MCSNVMPVAARIKFKEKLYVIQKIDQFKLNCFKLFRSYSK